MEIIASMAAGTGSDHSLRAAPALGWFVPAGNSVRCCCSVCEFYCARQNFDGCTGPKILIRGQDGRNNYNSEDLLSVGSSLGRIPLAR